MKNTFGNAVQFSVFGESHGAAVGGCLAGLAAGIPLDAGKIALQMQKRRAKADGLSTSRIEQDEIVFLSGVHNGVTTGSPLAFTIQNQNTNSADYAKTQALLRPGHADYTAQLKYGGFQDARGGGHFSGRVTAALVAAGAICAGILQQKGILVATHIQSIAGIPDTPLEPVDATVLAAQLQQLDSMQGFPVLHPAQGEKMQAAIRAAAAQGDSVGGVLQTGIVGDLGGIGEPFFDSVESTLAHLLFSIPAVKGVQFGAGFGFATMQGSEANDPFCCTGGSIRTATNHNGGINGGIANGMPILLQTVIKPTPSIFQPQNTVDIATGQNATLALQGRHDPCILHRAAIVQTAACCLGLVDLCTQRFGTLWQQQNTPCDTK